MVRNVYWAWMGRLLIKVHIGPPNFDLESYIGNYVGEFTARCSGDGLGLATNCGVSVAVQDARDMTDSTLSGQDLPT